MRSVNGVQNQRMDRLLTATEEAALVAEMRGRDEPVGKAMISRARSQDPAHPAYRLPDGTFSNPACDTIRAANGLQVRAPEAAVRAFWASRRRGPKPRTATPQPQEQQS